MKVVAKFCHAHFFSPLLKGSGLTKSYSKYDFFLNYCTAGKTWACSRISKVEGPRCAL